MNTEKIKITELKRAGEIISQGGLVAFPTETVYGLGADAMNGAAVKKIFEAASYFDTIAKTSRKIQPSKIAKALKYSKGPSIEKRSGEIYSLLKKEGYLQGMPKPNENNPYSQVCRWEPVNFQIKNLGNDVRMALKNYFTPNDDNEMVNNEVNNIKNNIVVIFDDNVSGGATLSDICLQLQNLGVEYIVPITFGKMRESWNVGTMTINKTI